MRLKITDFFKNDISKIAFDKKKPIRSFFIIILRTTLCSAKSFFKDECHLKSALLTFYSLIAIVPFLTIVFSIAKGFGFDQFLQKEIIETFKEQKDVLSNAMRFAYLLMGQIEIQVFAGIGVLVLFISIFGLFENIEKSLNDIWKIKKHRRYLRRAINYFIILIFFPSLFIASSSFTIFINAEIIKTAQAYAILKSFSTYALWMLKLVPYILMSILFSFMYLFTPNTKIYFKSRLIAGIIGGTLFQFWQIIYLNFQFYLSKFNVVFGSLAALPLFLIWTQVNFIIFLYCAELAAQMENDRFLQKSSSSDRFKMITPKQLVLLVLYEITNHFIKGIKPISIDQISEHLGIPLFDVREALALLEKEGIIAEIASKKGYSEKYQLIVNPELYTIQSICDLVDKNLWKLSVSKETNSLNVIFNSLSRFDQVIKDSGSNLNLKDLVRDNL